MYEYALAEPLLQLQDIMLRLGDRQVLDGVSATIMDVIRPDCKQGQVVSFLGPSGVGKSQTFWMIAGLNAPDSGQVVIGHRGSNGTVNYRQVLPGDVGVVTQHYTLFDHRTVMGNLLVAGAQRGLTRVEALARAQRLLSRFGMSDRADSYPRQLSGGQRQRIAIAQQLICSDKFLLMDEPFSGLDPVMKDEACRLIEEISREDEDRTIIVITHDIKSAVLISDTIWLIGRDRDEAGNITSGAKIQEEIDLKARDIAWRPQRASMPEFSQLVHEIEERFKVL